MQYLLILKLRSGVTKTIVAIRIMILNINIKWRRKQLELEKIVGWIATNLFKYILPVGFTGIIRYLLTSNASVDASHHTVHSIASCMYI